MGDEGGRVEPGFRDWGHIMFPVPPLFEKYILAENTGKTGSSGKFDKKL